jgi:hypothetical protein
MLLLEMLRKNAIFKKNSRIPETEGTAKCRLFLGDLQRKSRETETYMHTQLYYIYHEILTVCVLPAVLASPSCVMKN